MTLLAKVQKCAPTTLSAMRHLLFKKIISHFPVQDQITSGYTASVVEVGTESKEAKWLVTSWQPTYGQIADITCAILGVPEGEKSTKGGHMTFDVLYTRFGKLAT